MNLREQFEKETGFSYEEYDNFQYAEWLEKKLEEERQWRTDEPPEGVFLLKYRKKGGDIFVTMANKTNHLGFISITANIIPFKMMIGWQPLPE